jgi:hypothetical protein
MILDNSIQCEFDINGRWVWQLPERLKNNKYGEILSIMMAKKYKEQPTFIVNNIPIPNVSSLFQSGIASFKIVDGSIRLHFLHQRGYPCVVRRQIVGNVITVYDSIISYTGSLEINGETYTYSKISPTQLLLNRSIPDNWYSIVFNELRIVLQVKLGNYFFSDEYEETV